MAFADAIVLSEPETLDRSVSNTPDARSATSMLLMLLPVPFASNVLLVNVCDPASVATVLSIANVTAFPDPVVSIPVPPVNVNVSLSRSMLNAPPESPWKSRSDAVTCAST